jgi:hypothetical protein
MTTTLTTTTTTAADGGTVRSVGTGGRDLHENSDTASGTSGAPPFCQPIGAGQFVRSSPGGGQRYESPARGSFPLHGVKNIPLLIVPLTWGGIAPLLLLAAIPRQPFLVVGMLPGRLFFARISLLAPGVLCSLLVRGDQAGAVITSCMDPPRG